MFDGMIVELLNRVDTISEQFVINGYQRIADTYAPVVYGMISLSVILYGFATLQGWVSLSLAETGKRLLLIGAVLVFALNWGMFSTYVYKLFTISPNEISSLLIQSISHTSFNDADGVNGALQKAWEDGMQFFSALWDRGGISNALPYIFAIGVMVVVLLLIGISLIELIVSKFGLAIYLILAPLMVPMLLFKTTKEMLFDGWLKHLISFAMIPIFVTASLALGLTLLSSYVNTMKDAISADAVTLSNTFPYIIFAVVSIGLVLKATQMATSIAGGISAGMAPFVADAAKSMGNQLQNMLPRSLPKNNPQPPKFQPSRAPNNPATPSAPSNPSTSTPLMK